MNPHSLSLILTLLLVFVSAIVGGVVAKRLKQPMLLGYIAGGIVFGNLFPQFTDYEFLHAIADSGVTLLLFTLGIEFSFHRLRKVLGTVAWTAVVQILVCIFLFLLLSLSLGFAFIPALFIAIAGSLSSTAVVVKVLSERGELDTAPGEVMTGWLVVQDLAVVPLMILLPALVALTTHADTTVLAAITAIVVSLLKAAAALSVIVILGRFGMPRVLSWIASLGSREIFVLFTVGLVFLAGLVTYVLGMSAALGAFIAGLLIAETTQNHEIFAEIRPLRDLFAVVFFVSLGMALPVSFLVRVGPILLVLTAAIMGLKAFMIMGLTRFVGYHRKTAFLAAVGLTQMSEFGFIIAKEGLSLGALTRDDYTLLVALTFLTILLSAPLLSQGHSLYSKLQKALGGKWPKIFHTNKELGQMKEELPIQNHIVLVGYGRVGRYIGRALEMASIPFLVVDYNAATVKELKNRGISVVYGDPADKDVLDYAQVDLAKAVILAIPDRHTQEMVIAHAQTLNRRIKIICRTHFEEDQKHLKSLGVQVVIQPEFEAALSIVGRLLPEFGISEDDVAGKVSRLKIEHGLG